VWTNLPRGLERPAEGGQASPSALTYAVSLDDYVAGPKQSVAHMAKAPRPVPIDYIKLGMQRCSFGGMFAGPRTLMVVL
jgi:hypothetical protein